MTVYVTGPLVVVEGLGTPMLMVGRVLSTVKVAVEAADMLPAASSTNNL